VVPTPSSPAGTVFKVDTADNMAAPMVFGPEPYQGAWATKLSGPSPSPLGGPSALATKSTVKLKDNCGKLILIFLNNVSKLY